ncbi:increased DNA methylation 3 isoform X2 [Vigna radiata var. radiata]|uniref:Increased DNA methylation 3 isoform X2 n=1 Tax=Vigna radiata var. radiata TaxID=3916 RepID=A0A1S3VFH3_VIGRR|nr:increased DNA methylation 3 isoform X2 [Vigna radiata var. radiata]
MNLRGDLVYKRRSVKPVLTDSDRKFLIEFIITTYLGPDVKYDDPRCSIIQRRMAGSPQYTLSDLGSSYVTISFLERLYYYVLRHCRREHVLDLNMFHMYLKGKLILPSPDFSTDSKQFTSFFPLDLHEQKWYPDSFRIVKGIVLIDDPSIECIKEDDLNRFKSLTGVSTLEVNLSECLENEVGHNCKKKRQENIQNMECQSEEFQEGHKRKHIDDTQPMPDPMFPTKHNVKVPLSNNTCKSNGPTFMPLLSVSDTAAWNQDCSLVLTGTARKGMFGPSVGIVDIGIGEMAYLFRISLPGVQKNCGKFSCDVQSNGRVLIKGVVTGGETIRKQARVFQMKIRKLCPPGPFTLSFSLPGPVDPRLFAANFRADGLLEGIAIKQ